MKTQNILKQTGSTKTTICWASGRNAYANLENAFVS